MIEPDSPLRTISVIGAGTCDESTARKAEIIGRELARAGFTVVCGGLSGVMQAACKGARSVGGRTVGILPGLDPCSANPYVDVPLVTGLGQMRNALVVGNGRVAVAVEGGSGTLSEIGLALKAGKPVVALGCWGVLPGVHAANNAHQAAQMAIELAVAGMVACPEPLTQES